jgi:Fe-S cluster biogenesis protein NfuA
MADVTVTLEFTPNPNTLKFVVNHSLLPRGAANFTGPDQAAHAPLAKALFGVSGVQAVMVGTNFVTITKGPQGNWDVVAEKIPQVLESHLKAGKPVFDPEWKMEGPASPGSDSAIVARIREILDREIRPAVAMDGGDITFHKYDQGVVYLHLQGSCSSCPSSVMTLKMGVETRLKDAIPEVREVVQI